MVAPEHVQVSWRGRFGSITDPVEIWQIGLAFSISGIVLREHLADFAEQCSLSFSNRVLPSISNEAALESTRAALISGDTGRTVRNGDGAFVQGDYVGGGPGGSTVTLPFQTALAITLETGRSGNVGRGRFFLPVPAAAGSTTLGLVTGTAAQTLATSMAAFINDLNTRAIAQQTDATNPLNVGPVVVASGGSVTKAIPPALVPVTGVSVGRVVDTQRRRRNALDEQRVTAALA